MVGRHALDVETGVRIPVPEPTIRLMITSDRRTIFVVTPTYNEKDNLPLLVEKIFNLKIPNLTLVIVDDNSPDGTGKLADKLAESYPIQVIHRSQKLGLGTAYTTAFEQILKEKPNYIIQMDADLSHDPTMIPKMLESITTCDVVIGSRYVKAGGIENWNWSRRLISRFGNLYARLILNLPYRDLTGGFKCWRRKVLEKIDFNALSSIGYNFQIETTYRAHKLGCKIKEIPIIFSERKVGDSKFNASIILESFIKVLLLRLRG